MQCHKRLYLQIHQPEFAAEPDEGTQARFEQGTEVGQLARGLFPEGVLVEAERSELNKAIALTSGLVTDGEAQAVFEATFDHQKVLVRVDVLQRLSEGKRWKLIEVKSSTRIKDYHLPDVAVQRFVLEGQGLTVIPCLMHLNREYVYNGRTHDLSKLFTIEDITAETDNLIKDVPAEVRAQFKMLERLATLLEHTGWLSGFVIDEHDDMPSTSAYRTRIRWTNERLTFGARRRVP